MSGKDTVMEKSQKNNSQKESISKTSILLFNFSKLKQNANVTVSDYNLFNYNFSNKDLFDLNQKKEPFKKRDSEYINENTNLNLIKNISIEIPSSEKLWQNEFINNFLNNYETSFANFCEIDKELFTKAFIYKNYVPQLDKLGDIKISIKNLLDILKHYSQFLKLKIRRRFLKKYKKKKLFKTLKNNGDINSNKINKEGLKLLSLKKNLKISVKKHNGNSNNNNINNFDSTGKENIREGNFNYNPNNNFLNSINNILSSDCLLSNNLFNTSLFNFQPTSNYHIPGSENIFTFSAHDQNYLDLNNINNINPTQLTNNHNIQLLNKKRNFTPYIPFTPYYNNNNQNMNQIQNINQSNKKINQNNINIMTPICNPLISPQILNYKDYLTPSAIQFSQNDLISPNIVNDAFNFSNIRSPFSFGNINNQSPIVINNNINTNLFYGNITNNKNENIPNNINQNDNYIISPNNNNNNLLNK